VKKGVGIGGVCSESLLRSGVDVEKSGMLDLLTKLQEIHDLGSYEFRESKLDTLEKYFFGKEVG